MRHLPILRFLSMLLPLLASCAAGSTAGRSDPADGQPVERRAVLSTGIDARWIEVGDPRGVPVLFLHGYTDTSRSFLPTLHALTALRPDLRLIALDQRGHGGSSLPADDGCRAAPERCFEVARLAADALALLDREGIERTYLVGHSMGSIVAQEIALTHPERIDRLVLIGTSSRMAGSHVLRDLMNDGLVEGPWKKAVEARGLRFPADAWAMSPRDLDPQIETWLAANWVAEPGADPAHLAAIVPETASLPLGTWIGALRMQLAHDGRERLTDLRVPTLVLFPIQDLFFQEDPDHRDLRAALQRASATHGTKWFWKRYGRRAPTEGPQSDLGHNLHWAAPGPVARDLAAFLRPEGAPTADLAFLEGGEAPRLAVEAGGALVLGPAAR